VRTLTALGLAAVTLAATSVPLPALAHAIVLESRPAPNAAVTQGDVPVELRFNSRIDRKRSRLTLAGPNGSSAQVPIEEEGPPDRLAGKAAGLAPGEYRLKWQVLSVDGHITRGEIPFRVDGR
jgi:methionine-rich copper-binding protein CopC